ncbi:MAG: DUF4492 domain-containing protein [Bacteroidales bacterium]|jgi:Na+/H+ antiporter NhaD/arsenite permease-like protein|nr:DUF4492 domain-containing protein [Bacteroidales bacterium]
MWKQCFLYRIFRFYHDGFTSMKIGKKLWLIILVKLFIMFAVFRIFFFKNYLNSRFDNQQDKSEYVIDQLVK